MPGQLYLIPNAISGENYLTIPSYIAEIVSGLRYFFAEEEKSARKLLKRIAPEMNLGECQFFHCSEHTPLANLKENLVKVKNERIGLISEAGMPCVADPGSELVFWAHQENMEVIPLAGPSSIFLALMASGLNGQNFSFAGYLPKDEKERFKKIKMLEKRSREEGQTQIFMETPYRNQNLLKDILKVCLPKTFLCIAVDLTGEKQLVKTHPVQEWRKLSPSIPKSPALFLLGIAAGMT